LRMEVYEVRRLVLTAGFALIYNLSLVSGGAFAGESLPYQAQDAHFGVTSCAGSTCHGSTIERSSNVEQNEYLVWSDGEEPDLHFSAYDILYSEE
jgi:hypothetical protein